jgi:large-conductance mechanosensitive channel
MKYLKNYESFLIKESNNVEVAKDIATNLISALSKTINDDEDIALEQIKKIDSKELLDLVSNEIKQIKKMDLVSYINDEMSDVDWQYKAIFDHLKSLDPDMSSGYQENKFLQGAGKLIDAGADIAEKLKSSLKGKFDEMKKALDSSTDSVLQEVPGNKILDNVKNYFKKPVSEIKYQDINMAIDKTKISEGNAVGSCEKLLDQILGVNIFKFGFGGFFSKLVSEKTSKKNEEVIPFLGISLALLIKMIIGFIVFFIVKKINKKTNFLGTKAEVEDSVSIGMAPAVSGMKSRSTVID